MNHPRTVLAIVATTIFLVPGYFVGAIVKSIYRGYLGGLISGSIFDWLLGEWLNALTVAWFPELLHGLIGGGIAVWLASRVMRGANFDFVAYGASTVVVLFFAAGLVLQIAQVGMSIGAVAVVAGCLGTLIGLVIGCQSAAKEQTKSSKESCPGTLGR